MAQIVPFCVLKNNANVSSKLGGSRRYSKVTLNVHTCVTVTISRRLATLQFKDPSSHKFS
jgi:hypothetical protein